MQPMRRRVLGILFVTIGMAGFAIALVNPSFGTIGVVLGLGSFFAAGTLFGKGHKVVTALQPFVSKLVRVEIWGVEPPSLSNGSYRIDSMSAIGAGLHIFLQAVSGGPLTDLKVAQPERMKLEDGRFEVPEAAYVSLSGRKLKPIDGTKEPALVVFLC